MSTNNIPELLSSYVEKGSEAAFRELVTRYVDLVYSTALRRVHGNASLAEDVVQTVFADLARKAATLPRTVLLGGWLHRHTGFVAGTLLRSEIRRQHREREAAAMNLTHGSAAAEWHEVAPLLDDAIEQLEPADRDAITLRFLEQRDFRSVGLVLGVSDDTAQKRVSRAVEKLRALLVERGATLTAAALGTFLSVDAITAAPAYLAAKACQGALAAAGKATGAGIVAVVLKWLLTPAGVGVMAATTLVAVLAAKVSTSRSSEKAPAAVETRPVAKAPNRVAKTTSPTGKKSKKTAPVTSPDIAPSSNPNVLRIQFLNAETGAPANNATVEIVTVIGGKYSNQRYRTDANGIHDVEVDRNNITSLNVITRSRKYADTRLVWNTKRGDTIPQTYTVRLKPGVPLSGTVLGPDDRPVAGAAIQFSHIYDGKALEERESHAYSTLQVVTDKNGRWELHRITEDFLNTTRGTVTHSNFFMAKTQLTMDSDRKAIEEMRAGTHVYRMVTPLAVSGSVVDESGQPIANATITLGSVGNAQATNWTDLRGHFTLPRCPPEAKLITAEAEGFGASTSEVALQPEMAPVQLVLKRGKALKIQVVNRAGAPIQGAQVSLDTVAPFLMSASGQTPKVQTKFVAKTDEAGRVAWQNAPDTELTFHVLADGYMRKRNVRLKPGDQEQVVSLAAALVVSGTVHDEATGQPVPKFSITTGYPQTIGFRSQNGKPVPLWSTNLFRWSGPAENGTEIAGGKFRRALQDSSTTTVNNSETISGYVFRVEAEGYAKQISRIIQADEGEARLSFQLRPVKSAAVAVLLPDGRPAAKTSVGLAAPGSSLRLLPDRITTSSSMDQRLLPVTDARGKLTVPLDESTEWVVSAHTEGFGEATIAELAARPVLQLQAWASIKGTYFSSGRPKGGARIAWMLDGYGANSIFADPTVYTVTTDEQGQFEFPKVPAGQHRLMRQEPFAMGGMNTYRNAFLAKVETKPGELTTVTLGIGSRDVTLSVVLPDGLAGETPVNPSVQLATPYPEQYRDKKLADLTEWIQSSEYREWMRGRQQFNATRSSDGRFTAKDVPPGTYELTAGLYERSGTNGTSTARAFKRTYVTIPEEPANGAMDIGEVMLVKSPPR